jgi:hypothetical protein
MTKLVNLSLSLSLLLTSVGTTAKKVYSMYKVLWPYPLRKWVSITLQKMEASAILSQAAAVGLTTSWIPPLAEPSSLANSDILCAEV